MNCALRVAASALLFGAGQPRAALAQRPQELPDPLLVRARDLSQDLSADAAGLSPHDRALLWARLGEVWWTDERERARALMAKAVEEVEVASESEDKISRARRLAAARALLSVVGARDRNLGERLAAVLASRPKSEEATDNKERGQNAEALADAGLEVLDEDPRRAAELGAASLRAGTSYKLGYLLSRLYKKDAGLAVSLFKEALAAARASRRSDLLRVLAGEAFPNRLYFPPSLTPIFPEEIQVATLSLMAENLLRASASAEEDGEVCSVAWTAVSLVEEFTALLPQQAPAVRVVINRCRQQMDGAAGRHMDGKVDAQKLKTADDYLRAAADAKDERVRNLYLGQAAYVAYSSGEPDRAIEIVEGMDSNLREEMKETWEAWRWEFAAASAVKHFKGGDRQTVRKVLDAVPPKLRAAAVLSFLEQLAESNARDFPTEMLGEARALAAKYENPETGFFLLALARLYAAYVPADGPLVFGEAVAAVNRQWRSRPAGASATSHEWPEYPWAAIALSVPLIEADEPGVTSAAADIEDRLTRARVRLGLLGALLEKRRAGLQAPAVRKPAAAPRRPAP